MFDICINASYLFFLDGFVNINLCVIKGKLRSLGPLDLEKFYLVHGQKNGVKKLNGRLDFYHKGNIFSVTRNGYFTIYITIDIAVALNQLEKSLVKLARAFGPYSRSRIITEVSYRTANIQLSGGIPCKGSVLLGKLKTALSKAENISEIVIGSEYNITRILCASLLPVGSFLYSYIQVRFNVGKFKLLYSGSFTIITLKFKHIPFFEAFCSSMLT